MERVAKANKTFASKIKKMGPILLKTYQILTKQDSSKGWAHKLTYI